MQVTLQYAAEHFEELASVADSGEEVKIARPEMPALTLTVDPPAPCRKSGSRRILGALRGQIVVPSEEEWRKVEEELTDVMTNGPIFPPE